MKNYPEKVIEFIKQKRQEGLGCASISKELVEKMDYPLSAWSVRNIVRFLEGNRRTPEERKASYLAEYIPED